MVKIGNYYGLTIATGRARCKICGDIITKGERCFKFSGRMISGHTHINNCNEKSISKFKPKHKLIDSTNDYIENLMQRHKNNTR